MMSFVMQSVSQAMTLSGHKSTVTHCSFGPKASKVIGALCDRAGSSNGIYMIVIYDILIR